METIHRAASAATGALFGEHGEHGGQTTHGNTGTTTHTNAAGESTHEPLSGRTGDTKAGEPYDAGNLGEFNERSQQRIAASRGEPTNTTGTAREYNSTSGTAGGYAPTTSTTGTTGGYAPTPFTNSTAREYNSTSGTAGGYAPTTSTTGTAGGYAPTTSTTKSTTGKGERRSSDISPRSGPTAGTIPIPSSIDRQVAGGGSYSSARETAARAMGSAETPGSGAGAAYAGAGAGAAAGGAGLWSAGQRKEDVSARDENGYRPGEEGYTSKGTEAAGKGGQQGQKARFAGGGGEADAADVTPSRANAEGKKVTDVSETSATGRTGTGAGAGPTGATHGAGAGPIGAAGAAGAGAAGAGAATGGAAGEGAPLGRRQSLTAHLPGEPGGVGMRRTSGAGEGTGEQWVKSSGMKADGGDFDASAPGAGREADRLLTEKGITRSGADEKKVTGEMDTKAPDGHNNASENDKLGLKDKLKNKLHKGPL
ncbi:hypothetical protein VF21_10020 [Pseudogymnoascus sp. 05NY08]|nr:hypothetical protein VF21_10020 [Pseudogymnoascus sp. 05NY08]